MACMNNFGHVPWVPAFAGMTVLRLVVKSENVDQSSINTGYRFHSGSAYFAQLVNTKSSTAV